MAAGHRPTLPGRDLANHRALGPHALRARERALALVHDDGFEQQTAVHTYQTILHYTIGLALVQDGLRFRTRETTHATHQYLADLSQETFPANRTLARELAEIDIGREHELGLSAILAGLQARRTRTPDEHR